MNAAMKPLLLLRRLYQECKHPGAPGKRAHLKMHTGPIPIIEEEDSENPKYAGDAKKWNESSGARMDAVKCWCDNEGVWRAARSEVRKGTTLFHAAKHHIMVDRMQLGSIDLKVVKTQYNVADMLTKTLSQEDIERHWKSFPWKPPDTKGIPTMERKRQAQ